MRLFCNEITQRQARSPQEYAYCALNPAPSDGPFPMELLERINWDECALARGSTSEDHEHSPERDDDLVMEEEQCGKGL